MRQHSQIVCEPCGTLIGKNDKWHWMRTADVLANGGREVDTFKEGVRE